MTERFLRIMVQLAVQHCLRSEAAAAANLPPGAPRPTALSFIAVDAAVRLFVCLITQHGGTVLAARLWDERKLAYPINGHKKGVYWLTYFRMPGAGITPLERQN